MSSTDACAELIWQAWTTGERMAALPAEIRPADADAAWRAQRALDQRAGHRYGWKIAATSLAGQAHIAVDGPLPGPLYERFRHEPGDVLPSHDLHMRVVEAEFAFRMGRDVPAGADVVDAVAALHLAVEIPDSRFTDFVAVGGPSLLADAACAGRFVLGPEVAGWQADDLAARATTISVNGEPAAHGSGSAVLGHPLAALRWLADDLAARGETLRAGDIVTTGTTTAPPTIAAGDTVRADFGDYGAVELSFRH
ncbi:2-keto-4-pentenoate hydratase [Pseudonocardia sp. CA-107938]|uniref:2-keto-4-pentenoate hydratase n=1 Tax=Pseudonocardia sp. CA-107938 TaxID=3240021 RepID=UPI003D8B0E30